MTIDLRDLTHHRTAVRADRTLEEVYQFFAKHDYEFMAVLDGDRLLGMCARRDVGMLLGSRYGFSLYAQKPISSHLKPSPAYIVSGTPITEVFVAVFSRCQQTFYDDVLLVGADQSFIGFIDTQTLVKLQNRFHLENIELLQRQKRELNLHNERIDADLRMSRELQRALLPDQYPSFPPEAEPGNSAMLFHHRYHPYGTVGGDFFHIRRLSDSVAGVFIADVMGHGVCSALGTAILRALLEELVVTLTDPGQVLGHLNAELTKILRQVGNDPMFVTAMYIIVDSSQASVCYATAGHPMPLHVRNGAQRAETLNHPNPGTVLGLFEDVTFHAHEQAVAVADSIILFTDGILDVEDAVGQEFGVEGLLQAARSRLNCPTEEMLEALLTDARQFSANHEFSDDVCLVAIDIKHTGS